MNTHDIELPPLPEPTWVDGEPYWYDRHMEAYALAAIEADRKRRGEPVAWLRNERDGYAGKEIFDPLVILGSAPPIKTANGATYSPVFTAPQPAEPVGEVVVTKDEHGRIVAVTRQDREGRILKVIAISEGPQPAEPTNKETE